MNTLTRFTLAAAALLAAGGTSSGYGQTGDHNWICCCCGRGQVRVIPFEFASQNPHRAAEEKSSAAF